jgi:alpha-1,6-mannosyltransferase
LTYGIPFRNVSNTLRTQFDHLSFPGAVPRSFAGALVLSTMSQPFVMLLDNKIDRQLLGAIAANIPIIHGVFAANSVVDN